MMRGILDSFRREQQQQQQQKAGGGAAAPPAPAPLSSGSGSDEDSSTVIQSILMDGITFTEDDTPCPTDCVLEVFSDEELSAVLRAALPEALIVVDWYKDDCTACKYMAPVFHRACRSSSEHAKQIIFVKHNIYDEDGELTPLARKYKFKTVPTFTFHKNGQLVESFATNKKDRLTEAINKHAPVVVSRWADEDE